MVELFVNSMEENTLVFCPNYVQEFGLWPGKLASGHPVPLVVGSYLVHHVSCIAGWLKKWLFLGWFTATSPEELFRQLERMTQY